MTVRRIGVAVVLITSAVAFYVSVVRSWMLNWGATEAEVRGVLPGESVVAIPRYQSRRAIPINAPVEEVWGWLVQIGQGRGGFYSYDWLENLFGLNIHSTDQILPELQHLGVGDFIAAEPNQVAGWRVTALDPPRSLVLTVSIEDAGLPDDSRLDSEAFSGVWIFQLNPIDNSSCRLLVDFRADFGPGPLSAALSALLLEPVHFIMERKMLIGIKKRAERNCEESAVAGRPGAA